MRRKIIVTASAMLLAAQLGSPVSAAQPSTDQLSLIAAYLEANDVRGLRAYLKVYPDLAEGNTPLAILLRRFLVESAAGNNYYRFRPDLSNSTGRSESAPQAAPPGPAEPAY